MAHRTFEEIQRFNQVWLWIVIVSVSLLLIVQIPLALINSAGDGPLPTSSILILIFSLAFVIGLNALFIFSRLKTKIDSIGVGITFQPFINKPKIFRWDEIEKAFVRKYNPLWEYGGWGIRYRWNSRAYNTSGNIGLQLNLKTGKKVLLGTLQPDEMELFLSKYIFSRNKTYNTGILTPLFLCLIKCLVSRISLAKLPFLEFPMAICLGYFLY